MGSHGQLARSWNEALTNGFHNLSSPRADVVVTVQGDAVLAPTWWAEVHSLLERSPCRLLQFGEGDQLLIYTAEAVRRIGLWDERFTGVTFQEADYFLRARMHFPEGACLHDYGHARVFTPLDDWQAIAQRALLSVDTGFRRGYPERSEMQEAKWRTMMLFERKWRYLYTLQPGLQTDRLQGWNLTYSPTAVQPCPKAASPQEPLYTPFEDGIANRECVFGITRAYAMQEASMMAGNSSSRHVAHRQRKQLDKHVSRERTTESSAHPS